jgi:hypothetical protein
VSRAKEGEKYVTDARSHKEERKFENEGKNRKCEAIRRKQVTDKQPTTQNDSEYEKLQANLTDGRGRVARHRRSREQAADYGGDERICGSELKPEAGTRQGNDGSQ